MGILFARIYLMTDDTHYLDSHPRLRVFLLALLLLFTIVLGLGTYAAAKLKKPYKENAALKTVAIKKGMSGRQIANVLEHEKIISGDRVFLYYVWIKGAPEKILAGSYELSAAMTVPEIVEKLTRGEVVSNEIRLRIGEGWHIERIAQTVAESGLNNKDKFYALVGTAPWQGGQAARRDLATRYQFLKSLPDGASLEGYLFPDTYFVSRNGGGEELAIKALENFGQKVTEEMLSQAKVQNRSLHEVITVASLIEGEVGRTRSGQVLSTAEAAQVSEERHIVSDIFWKRLRLGMALQSDATVGYATGKPRRQATAEDLKINSPYNTYKFAGLPPGPINNPSLAAIQAALNPAETDYLYFLSAPDGKAYFAKTLAEHNRNREKYLSGNGH